MVFILFYFFVCLFFVLFFVVFLCLGFFGRGGGRLGVCVFVWLLCFLLWVFQVFTFTFIKKVKFEKFKFYS